MGLVMGQVFLPVFHDLKITSTYEVSTIIQGSPFCDKKNSFLQHFESMRRNELYFIFERCKYVLLDTIQIYSSFLFIRNSDE